MTARKIHIEDNMCTIYKLVLHKVQHVLVEQGYTLAREAGDADILLAGVCAAFDADENRSMAIVEKMRKTGKPFVVYGCMTQVNPQKLDAPLLFASWEADELVRHLTESEIASHTVADGALPDTFRSRRDYRVYNPRKRFIGISTGCSFECSYCPHKKGAGTIRSISRQNILDMVATAVESGGDTIVLTGIDTACYGVDIETSYYDLLRDILQNTDSRINIHIAQFNPEGLFLSPDYPRKMLELWSDPRIKDIQLPIQTASPRLLALMNRNYCMDALDNFLASLKKSNPQVMLRTDLLVGFPTETMEELESSITFTADHYSEAALYLFEMKQGTPISTMDLSGVALDEAKRRLDYAADKLRASGLLVHSGGQALQTLLTNDKTKETLRS